ncbi:DUF1033 family protein [Salinicoccus halodurans]|uniref:DUF1033 domain-containing protein n=1 Tax=Salinicoccus halodurans TaxID=407035 RepID=A0A0F7HK07_9STAP|nr:DUF1033 family protein [Salinicoccus halodurans]AKG74133.1 hypothetical protein AAT16_07730 [Salinicoccus halodurans]SFK60945.1 hypothetical protein SAMN05216235_0793 [Salinicoccus halodurans]
MFHIVILKADYEGWWLFEDWQQNIVERYTFGAETEMRQQYEKLLDEMKNTYHSFKTGKYEMHAFFNGCELEYCDDCGEDIQIYYTPIMLEDDKVYIVKN